MSHVLPSQAPSVRESSGKGNFYILETVLDKMKGYLEKELFSKIREILISFHHHSLSPTQTEQLLAISSDCSKLDNGNAIKLFYFLRRKKIITLVHLQFFEKLLSYSSSYKTEIFTDEEVLGELDAMRGFSMEPNLSIQNGIRYVTCTWNEKISILGQEFTTSLTADCIVPEKYPSENPSIVFSEPQGITISELNSLQKMVQYTVELDGNFVLLDAFCLVQDFISEIVQLQVDKFKLQQEIEFKIPYLPPLRTMHDYQMQCNSIPLHSFSIFEIQEQLRRDSLNMIGKMHSDYKIIEIENIVIPEVSQKFISKLTEVSEGQY